MIKTALDEAWIRRFHRGPRGSVTLVCFPHAGGSASYFRPLSAALQTRLQVLAVQYPGRQDRMRDPFLSSIGELADEVYDALGPVLNRPVAFFGHSMGAMIAFEVTRRMKERRDAAPTALFVSGRRAPSRHRDETIHMRDDSALVVELRQLSGTDMRILDDEDVLRMVLPPMRNDYKAVETYRYQSGPLLDCPVVALIGEDDDKIDLEEAQAWNEHTTGEFTLRAFPGGHFYLDEQQDAVVDLIDRQLGSR